GLMERRGRVDAAVEVKVYPDLREIRRYEITLRRGLAYDAGQRRARIPGAGSLFARLREYGPDDDPRSISWAATARRGRPIAVEYETERQQRLLILLDAGRMMSSTLGTLTKLDHAVNTAFMLAYVGAAKGDEVGLLGFADDVRSYLPPRRGRGQFLRITEELRRIAVTTTESDYRSALEFLRARAARRALVVLFTDLVDEEASRSLVAAVTRLAGNNLVLCCLLADPELAEVAARVPDSTVSLYERVVAREVRDARAKALATLRRRGVHTIDVPSDRLTVATIQRYIELKDTVARDECEQRPRETGRLQNRERRAEERAVRDEDVNGEQSDGEPAGKCDDRDPNVVHDDGGARAKAQGFRELGARSATRKLVAEGSGKRTCRDVGREKAGEKGHERRAEEKDRRGENEPRVCADGRRNISEHKSTKAPHAR